MNPTAREIWILNHYSNTPELSKQIIDGANNVEMKIFEHLCHHKPYDSIKDLSGGDLNARVGNKHNHHIFWIRSSQQCIFDLNRVWATQDILINVKTKKTVALTLMNAKFESVTCAVVSIVAFILLNFVSFALHSVVTK